MEHSILVSVVNGMMGEGLCSSLEQRKKQLPPKSGAVVRQTSRSKILAQSSGYLFTFFLLLLTLNDWVSVRELAGFLSNVIDREKRVYFGRMKKNVG